MSLSQVQSSASLVSPVRLHHYFHLSVAKAGILFATVAFGCGSTVFMPGLQRDTDKAAFVSTLDGWYGFNLGLQQQKRQVFRMKFGWLLNTGPRLRTKKERRTEASV